MCRHQQLLGCVLMAFGLGVLIGTWWGGGFFCHLIGFALLCVGLGIARRR